jgi:hypothetical protein
MQARESRWATEILSNDTFREEVQDNDLRDSF